MLNSKTFNGYNLYHCDGDRYLKKLESNNKHQDRFDWRV